MEAILVLGAFIYGIWWLGKQLYEARLKANARRELEAAAAERQQKTVIRRQQYLREQRISQRVRQAKLNQKYRALQVALLQINKAPDFQRAASLAEAAREVPLVSRQRQYRRFRPQLIRYFASRLRSGTDSQLLYDSLTLLIEALGVPGFEASYIQQEAERQLQQRVRPSTESFSTTLERVQREHADRSAALEQANLEPETKQQLQEVQNQRLVESLMKMTLGDLEEAQ